MASCGRCTVIARALAAPRLRKHAYARRKTSRLALLREVIAAIREGLPSADQMPPGAVFQHVLRGAAGLF
jgi:hypothetical protein